MYIQYVHVYMYMYMYTGIIPYRRKRGPTSSAPYIGPRLGYSRYQYRVDTRKSTQVSYPCVAAATTDFSLIQAWLPIQSKSGHDTSQCVIECSRIKWAWLRSLAVLVLKRHKAS